MKDRTKKIIYWGLGLLIVIVLCILYSVGYRIQPNFSIAKNGTIEATIPLINTTVFVDGNQEALTDKDNQTVSISESNTKHTVLIGRIGYYPWTKDVEVFSNQKTVINPVFIPQNTTGEIITQKDPHYWDIRNQVEAKTLPTESNPIINRDGTTTMWVKNNTIFVKKDGQTITVITRPETIREVDFFKNRLDMVVFSSDTGVYTVDVTKDGTQNFFPIYKGQEPNFMSKDEHSLYVLDGQNLMEVVI